MSCSWAASSHWIVNKKNTCAITDTTPQSCPHSLELSLLPSIFCSASFPDFPLTTCDKMNLIHVNNKLAGSATPMICKAKWRWEIWTGSIKPSGPVILNYSFVLQRGASFWKPGAVPTADCFVTLFATAATVLNPQGVKMQIPAPIMLIDDV